LPASSFGLIEKEPFVLLPKAGVDLKVAMKNSVGQRFLQRDAHPYPSHPHPIEQS